MAWLEFEGRRVALREGDTVASALFRDGVRVFSRSFKFHRPRGLYCGTGDCPNCMVTVNGEAAVRSCVTPAEDGMRVTRGSGWPSADRDVFAGLWPLRRLLPVGFYYKTMVRPRWMWPLAEPTISRMAGIGAVELEATGEARERRHHTPDLLVVGGGPAGLSAALTAAESGESVLLIDEGRLGSKLPPGPTRSRVSSLLADVRGASRVTLLEEALAVGVYEGTLVPVVASDFLHLVHPGRVIVATGAVERHAVFPGSDLPGVVLGRGAARLAGIHSLKVGDVAVFVGSTRESPEHLEALLAAGVRVALAVVPEHLAQELPSGIDLLLGGEVIAVRGRRAVRSVMVRGDSGNVTVDCDSVVLSLGLEPRDRLLRMADRSIEAVAGAGEVVAPGCDVEMAIEGGHRAALGETTQIDEAPSVGPLDEPGGGFVCLCEDVTTEDLRQAWREGFRSTELLKRYSTATMGPCQGSMCQPHLCAFVEARAPGTVWSRQTTARPPARPVRLQDLAAGVTTALEYHTALHREHLERGAFMEWAGIWRRPETYGDPTAEYWAVRKGVSVMDLGTLGKYRVAGPDAAEFLERLYPCRVRDLAPGRSRYGVLLNEAGYVFDDGLICAVEEGGYYLTVTSGGAAEAEAWMKDWAESWTDLRVHIVNQTFDLGAIIVAGPRARELLARLTDDQVDSETLPHSGHREIHVGGIPCRAIRSGFVGEVAFELHHPASASVQLWRLLLDSGKDFDILPHGLEALRLLRLEKGHIIVGQDTDFDSTPAKLRMSWVAKMDKEYFVGQTALRRLSEIELARKLVQIEFPGPSWSVPLEGAQLLVDGQYTGELTSCRYSPVLGRGVALGWVSRGDGGFPEAVGSLTASGEEVSGRIVSKAFYDPEGVRLRA